MAGQRAPRRDAGSDLLRVELPLAIVGLQRHVAQLQHVGLYRQRRRLRLHVQRAVAQRDAVEIARFGDLAQVEAEIDAVGDQRLRLAVARQLHVFQSDLVRLAPRMGDFPIDRRYSLLSLIRALRRPAAQQVCPTGYSTTTANTISSSNVSNSFPINFIVYIRIGQKDTLFMPQLAGHLKGNGLIDNKKRPQAAV